MVFVHTVMACVVAFGGVTLLQGCGGNPIKDLEAVDKKGHWMLRIYATNPNTGCDGSTLDCWVDYWMTYKCGWRHQPESSSHPLTTLLADLDNVGKSKWVKYGLMAFDAGLTYCPETGAEYKGLKIAAKVAKKIMKAKKVKQFFDKSGNVLTNLFKKDHEDPPDMSKIPTSDTKYSNISCDAGGDFGRMAMTHVQWFYGDTVHVYQWVQNMRSQNTTTNETFSSEVWTSEFRMMMFSSGESTHSPCCVPGQFANDDADIGDSSCEDGAENLCSHEASNSNSVPQHTDYAIDISDFGQARRHDDLAVETVI